ncbi:MAG: M56 family metallopeptidase [Muribaculum sp.]|nr:M56 family metallopeptidase [Muribaculum sp.]
MANLFLSVVEISLSTGLIVLALIFAAPLLNKRYAAKWKYWLWIFLAVRLLIPVSGSALWAGADGSVGRESTQAGDPGQEAALGGQDGGAVPRIIVEVPEGMTTPIAAQSNGSGGEITLLDAAAWLWLAGCAVFTAFYCFSYVHYRRRVTREGKPLGDPEILELAAALSAELGIKREIPLLVLEEASSPMVIGFGKPLLLLPGERYSRKELYFILKHELVHVKRRDVYFKLLLTAAGALHWFNPVVWLMRREAAVDMELSCDERVVRGAEYDVRRAYTEILLSALHKKCAGGTVLSMQFYEGKQVMKKRFRNILLKGRKKNGLALVLCAAVLTVTLGTFIGCSAAKSEASSEGIVADGVEVPDIVLEEARKLVADWYADAKENNPAYHYSNWRIESLAQCYTYEDWGGMALVLYRLDHRFLSDTPEELVLAGGMDVTEDGWVTPDYADCRYLVFRQDQGTLSFLTMLFENDCFPGDETFDEDLRLQLGELGVLPSETDDRQVEESAAERFWVNLEGELFDSGTDTAGFWESLDTFVWMALRGGEITEEELAAEENAYIVESARALEGSAEVEDRIWVRVVQAPVAVEEGTLGQTAHKDYLFYRQEADAYVGIQSAEDENLWTLVRMADYGDWLEKQIRIYIRMTTGL